MIYNNVADIAITLKDSCKDLSATLPISGGMMRNTTFFNWFFIDKTVDLLSEEICLLM